MKRFFLIMVFFCFGCSSEYNLATKKQETLIYDTDKEVDLGTKVARQIEKKYKVNMDVDINERVEGILKRIVAVCDRKDMVYFIRVIDEDYVNAVSLPGGYVYVFKGLLDKVKNDDDLAGVIAHEVGHINARHAVKQIQSAYGAMILQIAALETGGGRGAAVANLALTSLFMAHSQQNEFEADKLSIKYLKAAGYNPQGMIKVLEVLQNDQAREIRGFSYWKTHPGLSKRISASRQEITGQIDFRDYVNLTGEGQ